MESCPSYAHSEEGTERLEKISMEDDDPLSSLNNIRRAIRLTRRSEDLGMPLHRPLYRRLAMGIEGGHQRNDDFSVVGIPSSQITPLTVPGHATTTATTIPTSPLPLSAELLALTERAIIALRINKPIHHFRRQKELVSDIFAIHFWYCRRIDGTRRRWHYCVGGRNDSEGSIM